MASCCGIAHLSLTHNGVMKSRDSLRCWILCAGTRRLLCYPGVSVTLFRTFHCVDIEGVPFLVADMREQCGTALWTGYAVWSAAFIALYTIGLPVGIFVTLYRSRHTLNDEATVAKLGYLYTDVGAHCFWGETAELIRKVQSTCGARSIRSVARQQLQQLQGSGNNGNCAGDQALVHVNRASTQPTV